MKVINTLAIGTILHGTSYDYRIIRVAGQGAFGITYVAELIDRNLKKGEESPVIRVAVKEFYMRDTDGRSGTAVTCSSEKGIRTDYLRKFINEAQMLSRLKHPHIVKVWEWWEANNSAYYAMEYIDGGTIDSLIGPDAKALQYGKVYLYARQIGSALSAMHAAHMLHLDVKPSNIMLQGSNAVLIDFGLAKCFDADGRPETSTAIGGGTPGYAPLEQTQRVAPGVFPDTLDVYAFGATIYKMVTGYSAPEASVILNNGFPREQLKRFCGSDSLVRVIEKAMHPLVNQRYQSIDQMMTALPTPAQVIGERNHVQPVAPPQKSAVAPKPKPNSPKPKQPMKPASPARKPKNQGSSLSWLWVPVLAVVVMVAGGLALYNWDKRVFVLPSEVRNQAADGKVRGHEYVDLGLSVKWATCNLGAESPYEYGDFYSWGELKSKRDFTSSATEGQRMGSIASKHRYDAALSRWGGTWRLPTFAEVNELINNCDVKWKGNGLLLTSRINGNSIFMPAAGVYLDAVRSGQGELGSYWTASPDDRDTHKAWRLMFEEGNADIKSLPRSEGRNIRPVTH